MDTAPWLQPTPMLDFRHPAIRALVDRRGWCRLPENERIGAVYGFVRAGGIACRFHGFTIDRRWLFQRAVRHWMKPNVARVRGGTLQQ